MRRRDRNAVSASARAWLHADAWRYRQCNLCVSAHSAGPCPTHSLPSKRQALTQQPSASWLLLVPRCMLRRCWLALGAARASGARPGMPSSGGRRRRCVTHRSVSQRCESLGPSELCAGPSGLVRPGETQVRRPQNCGTRWAFACLRLPARHRSRRCCCWRCQAPCAAAVGRNGGPNGRAGAKMFEFDGWVLGAGLIYSDASARASTRRSTKPTARPCRAQWRSIQRRYGPSGAGEATPGQGLQPRAD